MTTKITEQALRESVVQTMPKRKASASDRANACEERNRVRRATLGTNTIGTIHEALAREYMNVPGRCYTIHNVMQHGDALVVLFHRAYSSNIGGYRIVKEHRVAIFADDGDGVLRLKSDMIA